MTTHHDLFEARIQEPPFFQDMPLSPELKPRQEVTVKVTREDGSTFSFPTIARLDNPIEVTYYENGGILLTVLRRLLKT